VLIREDPATELTVATRILAHGGALANDGRVVLVTGEVVYVSGEGVSNHTMTPYDVTIVRLRDGLDLFGTPPGDIGRYLDALRARPETRAGALAGDGTVVTADSLAGVVGALLHQPWPEAEAHAKAAGALIGAYPISG
jgi:ribulose-5-phosphate 4-epimerase/fuculose-1-phosphate aldolase